MTKNPTVVIADAAKEALKVIADAAAQALQVTKAANGNDHDLLQRLDQKVDGIIVQITGINDGVTAQIKDHETRLNTLETAKTAHCVRIGTPPR